MKTYNSTNFFKHTFCEFTQVDNFVFPAKNYKSKSESEYFYTVEGVYRKSNHWGRVANCRWKLLPNSTYKNQQKVIAYAKWTDFHPINSSEKSFFINVNFDLKTAKIQASNNQNTQHLFTFTEAQKRLKKIRQLFKNDQWSIYYEEHVSVLRKKIITELINTNRSLTQIKSDL